MNGRLIKLHIGKSGTTNKELGQKLNLNPNTITAWINGRNSSNIEKFLELCAMIDLNPLDLIRKDS